MTRTERQYHVDKFRELWPHRHHPIDRVNVRWHLRRLFEFRDQFRITCSAGCETEDDGVTPVWTRKWDRRAHFRHMDLSAKRRALLDQGWLPSINVRGTLERVKMVATLDGHVAVVERMDKPEWWNVWCDH